MIVEEKTISSDRIYNGKVVSLKVDTVEIDNKGYQKREIVEHSGAVGIVAITENKEIILVKQYRKAIEKSILEIPAGKLEIGETPRECAQRELREETGYVANNLKLIHKFFSSPGFSNQKVYIFLATDLIEKECQFDDGENIEIIKKDIKDVYNMIVENDIEDAKTCIGVLLAKELL